MGIFDFVFPKMCLGCGKEGRYICEECVGGETRAGSVCPYCNCFSINGMTHETCQKNYGLDGLISIWKYKGVIKKAILALKYKYATEIGKEISEYTITSLGNLVLPSVHNLVPIPIYWHKENTRGFNQSIELGGNIAEKMRLKFIPDLLIKKVPTAPQAELSKEERQNNLKGSFILNSNTQIPNSVFLFDDVFTTGSTLFEAAKVLKEGSASKVWGLTIAR